MEAYNFSIAVLFARVFLGVLFLLQGYDKVFNIGIKIIIPAYRQELSRSGLPEILIKASAYYTSWVELIGGLLLVIGLMKHFALYALGIDLIMVTVAMGLKEPLWRMDYVFPRLALLLFLLFTDAVSDCFSLDFLFSRL